MDARTLFDKIWDMHVVADLGDGNALLHVDRLLLHDLSGARALKELEAKGLRVRNPELVFAVPDHAVSSAPGRDDGTTEISARLVPALRHAAQRAGIRLFDINDPEQGIVHIIGPEQGITLPGTLLSCGDSHTSTHGGLGALAFGIGSTEIVHVLVTQTVVQKRPGTMRVTFDGSLPTGVTPKDMILHLIASIGAGGGDGFAVEYAGPAVRGLEPEGRRHDPPPGRRAGAQAAPRRAAHRARRDAQRDRQAGVPPDRHAHRHLAHPAGRTPSPGSRG